MATAKAKTKSARKSATKTKAAVKKKAASIKKSGGLDLGKYLDDVKIGSFNIDDVLEGTNRNMEAIADANRAIIDGYTDIAKRQYEMLKDLLDELRKLGGDRSDVTKDLKKVVEQARKDLQVLQKMASKTNQQAQRIVKKRTDANIKAWKKLVQDAKKKVSKKAAPAKKKATAKKKAAVKKKATVKKKAAAAKRKVAAKRKAAPKKKAAAKS